VDVLSPAKLLVILVVALVVLGPEKLPKVARQIGNLWGDFRKFRERMESEVRGTFPDLPSTETITNAVRSPISFLDSLADSHGGENDAASDDQVIESEVAGDAVQPSAQTNRPAGTVHATEEAVPLPGLRISDPDGLVHQIRSSGGVVPDDPGLN
jgi:TatA/E family protein of Tat protein translocase